MDGWPKGRKHGLGCVRGGSASPLYGVDLRRVAMDRNSPIGSYHSFVSAYWAGLNAGWADGGWQLAIRESVCSVSFRCRPPKTAGGFRGFWTAARLVLWISLALGLSLASLWMRKMEAHLALKRQAPLEPL